MYLNDAVDELTADALSFYEIGVSSATVEMRM